MEILISGIIKELSENKEYLVVNLCYLAPQKVNQTFP